MLLSAIQSNAQRQQARLKLALVVLLPILFLLAASFLMLAWQGTSQVVHNSINYQMQEAHGRAQSRLDSYLAGLDNLLASTAENPKLAGVLQTGDRQTAKELLQNTLDHSYGEYLDLLLLTRQGQYWTNMNSPLYLLGNHLNSIIVDTHFFSKWSSIELAPTPTPLMAIIQRYPILDSASGMITGSLFGGMILNDNLTLLSLLGQGSTNKSLQLLISGQPVGPTFMGADISDAIFAQANVRKNNQGQIEGHYFSRQPLLINGKASKLQLLIIADKTMSQQFAYAYLYHLLLALVLVLLAVVCLLLVKYKK